MSSASRPRQPGYSEKKTSSSKQILLKIFSGFVFHICVDVTPLSFTLYSANIRVHLDNF